MPTADFDDAEERDIETRELAGDKLGSEAGAEEVAPAAGIELQISWRENLIIQSIIFLLYF